MAHFNQIVENLRTKYLEVRSMEKRSEVMMKQVIDTFYLMEGLDRLQTDLDCLDLLIHNNKHLEGMLKFKIDPQDRSVKAKVRNMMDRSVKAVTSLHIYRQVMGKSTPKHKETAYSQLKRITYMQQAKISELMKMVQTTIVSNFEVLEQLQQIAGMQQPDNVEPWAKIQSVISSASTASASVSKTNRSQAFTDRMDRLERMERMEDVQNLVESHHNECFSDGLPCKSCESLSVLGKATHSTHMCKMCRTTGLPFYQPQRMFAKTKLDGERASVKGLSDGELTIGDGQLVDDLADDNKDDQSMNLSPSKSIENFASNSHHKGDFTVNKLGDELVDEKEIQKSNL